MAKEYPDNSKRPKPVPRADPHSHVYDQFKRGYEELVRIERSRDPKTGNNIEKRITRTVAVWGCVCGAGGTRETR